MSRAALSIRGDRWKKGEERPPGRGERGAGTVRDTETVALSRSPPTMCVKEHGQRQ